MEDNNPNNLPIVSYSKINTYKMCPCMYKFAYIDKLPRLEKPYTNFGSYCHAVLEAFHKIYLCEHTKMMPVAEAMQQSFINAKHEWEKKLTKEQLREAYQIMVSYLELLNKTKIPNVINVEKKIFMPIDDEFILLGYIDRVQQDDDQTLHVVDYKTTKDERYLKDRTQLLLYCYSLYSENKQLSKIRSSYILLKHNMKSLVKEHNIAEIIYCKDKIVSLWRDIKEDKLFRAAPSNSCRLCDYTEYCKEYQKLNCLKNKSGKMDW